MPELLQRLQERVTGVKSDVGQFVGRLHLRHRTRGLWRHLKRGRHGIGALAALVAAWALPLLWTTTPDAHMRWMGVVLQIAGIGTVALGLGKTRKLFDVPSVWRSIVRWFRDVPRAVRGPTEATGTGRGAIGLGRTSASGRGYSPGVKDATLEGRVAMLEKQHNRMRKELEKVRKRMKEQEKEIDRKIENEESARKIADEKIREQIKEVSIGGLHLEVVGLIWLVVGIAVATLPAEIGALFSWW